ncbi:MAG: YdgA family protein [Desulfobacula sp.]|nr:YdgA family protein [Desulfobacula sp.]
MKKGFAVLGLLLILAGVGFPFFKGIVLERVIRQTVDDINLAYADSGQKAVIEIQEYDRRYSDSTIEWKLHLGTFKDVLGIEELILLDHVDHGYSKTVSSTSLEKNNWFKNFQNQNFNGENPVTIKTVYSLFGDIGSKIELASFSIKKGENAIQIKPGILNLKFIKKLKQIICQLSWEGIVFGKQHLTNVRFATQMDKVSKGIWSGTASFSVDSIISDDGSHFFEIKNFTTEYSLGYQKEPSTVSIGVTLGMDQFESSPMDIKNAAIQFGIKHLDAKGFEELVVLNTQMNARLMEKVLVLKDDPHAVAKEVQSQTKRLGREMIENMETFLRQGLEVSLSDFHAQIPQGEIKANMVLGLKKTMTLSGFLPLLMNPSYAMDIFSLKSDIQIPYTLVGYQKGLLYPLIPGMQTGLFITQGENLVHRARIRDGKLFLNQKEVILE